MNIKTLYARNNIFLKKTALGHSSSFFCSHFSNILWFLFLVLSSSVIDSFSCLLFSCSMVILCSFFHLFHSSNVIPCFMFSRFLECLESILQFLTFSCDLRLNSIHISNVIPFSEEDFCILIGLFLVNMPTLTFLFDFNHLWKAASLAYWYSLLSASETLIPALGGCSSSFPFHIFSCNHSSCDSVLHPYEGVSEICSEMELAGLHSSLASLLCTSSFTSTF